MNNIDILEEKEKRLRAYLAVLNEENILYKKEDAIEGIIKLFETLIAENKELKEKIKEINEEYSAEQKYEMENTIPKSKVEEILNKYKYTQIEDNKKIIQFYRELKSLLGKE